MGPLVAETAARSAATFEFGLPLAGAEDAYKYEYVATDQEDSEVFPWSSATHGDGVRPDFARVHRVAPPQKELHGAATPFWNNGRVSAAISGTEMPDFGWAIRGSCPGEDDEFKYYATGGEDDEVTSRWASRSEGSRRRVQRRRRRCSGVKIAQCLIALDRVEDPRRILRISRTRPLGFNAQWLLTSHLEARHGCISMILAGNTERRHAPGMFFVAMARVEDAQAILAGAEERELAIGNVDVRVRSFKRSSEA